jgi:tRNA pseudouridine55 synthase
MSIVNDLQLLIAQSRLFVSAEKLEKNKNKNKKIDRRGKLGREAVKVGQGGTLDPLANGVLGTPNHIPRFT